jgi:hypothetical protein
MLDEFDFFWPEEVVGVELEVVEVLLSEAFTWGEIRRMSW